jgi:S-layer homology domain
MKRIAASAAAALVLAFAAPSFAQPFADVPANHWAYAAIAGLAAKGLVEGYPDGTFQGDRAMTRYEMAMVVARLVARIESLQIPAPPPAPQVTAQDLGAIQRLLDEFRAELAALGVRVAAIEEEVNAIKARLDNVRVRGRFRFRYDGGPAGSGASVNGNRNTFANDSGTSPTVFRAREGLKVMFDGSVAPDIHAIIGLELATGISSAPLTFNSASTGGCANSSPAGAAAGANCTPTYNLGNVAEGYLDWNHAWGLPLRIQLGRMGGIQQAFGALPIQFGPYGLLLNTGSVTYGASAGNTGAHLVDGLRLSGALPRAAELIWQAGVWRVAGPNGGGTYFLGEDAYGVDASIQPVRSLRVGGYYVANTINPAWPAGSWPSNAASPLWHVYGGSSSGSATAMLNPPTAKCPAVGTGTLPAAEGGGSSPGGIECHALGSGGGGYVEWTVHPAVHLDAEAASWTDGVFGTADTAYWAGATLDLGVLTGIGHHLVLSITYENAGVNFYAPYQNDVDSDITATIGPGNAQLLGLDLSFDITDTWGVSAAYYTGSNISNGMAITEWRAGVLYRFAPEASLYTRVENQRLGGVSQYTLYRAELNYTF